MLFRDTSIYAILFVSIISLNYLSIVNLHNYLLICVSFSQNDQTTTMIDKSVMTLADQERFDELVRKLYFLDKDVNYLRDHWKSTTLMRLRMIFFSLEKDRLLRELRELLKKYHDPSARLTDL